MIWCIIIFTWALVMTGSHFSMAQSRQSPKRWIALAGVSLLLSLGLYYYLGYPNLPDHPRTEIAGLLNGKGIKNDLA